MRFIKKIHLFIFFLKKSILKLHCKSKLYKKKKEKYILKTAHKSASRFSTFIEKRVDLKSRLLCEQRLTRSRMRRSAPRTWTRFKKPSYDVNVRSEAVIQLNTTLVV